MGVKVLMIGAHNDECEYGCGGTAKLLCDKGCEVMFLNPACLWHKDDASEDERAVWEAQERRAAEILGAEKTVIGPRDTRYYRGGHEAVAEIESYILSFKPDIAFIHWPEDNHGEHRLVAHDSFNALTLSKVHGANVREIYAFEAGVNQSQGYFTPDFVINIDTVLPDVMKSLMCFKQPTANGEHLCREKKAGAAFRGMSNGADICAEGFKIIKYPNKNDDFILKELLNDNFRWFGTGMYPSHGKPYF